VYVDKGRGHSGTATRYERGRKTVEIWDLVEEGTNQPGVMARVYWSGRWLVDGGESRGSVAMHDLEKINTGRWRLKGRREKENRKK